MPTTPEQLIEIASRHQVFLEGFKTQIFKEYKPFLIKMSKDIDNKLTGKDLTTFTRKRLEKLLITINKDILAIRKEYVTKVFTPAINDLAVHEAGFEIRSLNQVVKHDFTIPSPSQLKSAVYTDPLSARNYDGVLLQDFIDSNSKASVKQVTDLIRSGSFQGLTTPQILRNVIGTRSGVGFTREQLAADARNMEMVVRTALQHVSVQAREETWRQNKDIVNQVEWVSTLDGRTSVQCRALDGERWKIDKGPRPPIHPRCRSTVVAVLDSRFSILEEGGTRSSRNLKGKVVSVDANETYYGWLKRQPKAFQDEIIGESRGKLLRSGELTVQRFADLQLNNKFKPRTLDEMRELEPLVFDKVLPQP